MAYEDWPVAYINIPQGGTWSESYSTTDEAGVPLALATGGYAAEAHLRDGYGGTLVASFASDGSGDGTIELSDLGVVTLTLPSSFTTAMDPTTNSRGQQTGVLVGDLEMWQTSTPTTRYRVLDFRARVFPEATT